MNFEQAGIEYARLQAEWRAGRLPPDHFSAAVAQLRVQDASGRWWSLDPASGQWMTWNGASWTWPVPPQPAQAPVYRPVPPTPMAQPVQLATRPARQGVGSALMNSLLSLAPGLLIDFLQRGAYYKTNPMAAAQFIAPSLLSSVAVALAPICGRWLAIMLVLGCLGWLVWPMIGSMTAQPGQIMQTQAGRGLVVLSLFSMVPRIWQAGRR